jgi:hypothetical protein
LIGRAELCSTLVKKVFPLVSLTFSKKAQALVASMRQLAVGDVWAGLDSIGFIAERQSFTALISLGEPFALAAQAAFASIASSAAKKQSATP